MEELPEIVGACSQSKYPRSAFTDPTSGVPDTFDATDCGNTFGAALGEPHEQPREAEVPKPIIPKLRRRF